MPRIASSLYMAVVAGGLFAPATLSAQAITIKNENDLYRVEIDQSHGVITQIRDKPGGLDLLQEIRLADNFKFSLPLPGDAAWQATEANYVLGKHQTLTSYEQIKDRVVLHWDGPLDSVFGQPYEVSVIMTVELVDQFVCFTLKIDNQTPYEIGEVFFPVLGGSLGLGHRIETQKQTELVIPSGVGVESARIFHTFSNFSWLGVIGPEQYYSYPDRLSMPWMQLYQPAQNRSVYLGAHDSVARFKVAHLEMCPGISGDRAAGNDSPPIGAGTGSREKNTDRFGGNWPRPEELNGLPAGVKLSFVHIPYEAAHKEFQSAPVLLGCHDGGWREGAAIYGHWLASQFDLEKSRESWMYQDGAYQDCRSVPYAALPEWAAQGQQFGVEGLLLSGWKIGGHDNGVPRFELDPNLGSRDEFRSAIQQCHELGTHVALLVNLQLISKTSEWYQQELRQYACRDRWGIVYSQFGWGGGRVPSQQLGSGERRVWINPGILAFRVALTKQLRELAELGVDGVYLQDFFARPLDFNPATGKTPDRASWEGGLECIEDILNTCRAVNPDFCVSIDTAWDRVLALTQTVSHAGPHDSAFRAAFPGWRPAWSVVEGYEYAAVNDALLYRGRIRIAQANGRPISEAGLGDLTSYIKVVLNVREVLRDSLVFGEPLPGDMFKTEGDLAISVFRHKDTSARTAVLVNSKPQDVMVRVPGFVPQGCDRLILWQPLSGVREVNVPVELIIPGDQVAILTEQPVLDRLAAIELWRPAQEQGQVVFDFRSASDLEGWTLTGDAFSVCSPGSFLRRPTLNSLGRGGESATGVALSTSFVVDPEYDTLVINWHGGTSQQSQGRENLAFRLLAADTGQLLQEITPPSNHVLRRQVIDAKWLRGKTVRVELVDRNNANTFAWIGLQRVSLEKTRDGWNE